MSRWFRSDALRKVDQSLEAYATARAAYESFRKSHGVVPGDAAAAAGVASRDALLVLSTALNTVRCDFTTWYSSQKDLPGMLQSLKFGRHWRNPLTSLNEQLENNCKHIRAAIRWNYVELKLGDTLTEANANRALRRAAVNAQPSLPQQRVPRGTATSTVERALAGHPTLATDAGARPKVRARRHL